MARIMHGTLSANVVTTVTLDSPYRNIEVLNRNGIGEIYFRCDGTTPVVGANDTYVVPAAIAGATGMAPGTELAEGSSAFVGTTVLLLSTAACTYTVIGS